MTVNFGAAKAPAHQCLPPLEVATDFFVFPRRHFFPLCLSAPLSAHIPWPNTDQQSAAPETLLCSAHPMESRGAVASRS